MEKGLSTFTHPCLSSLTLHAHPAPALPPPQVALVEVHCASEDRPRHPSLSASLLEEGRGEHDECSVKAAEIQQAIQEGARSFLATGAVSNL